MNPNEQELMERYIYQVVRRLPRGQRDEVGRELRELIGDMREEAGSMEEVLTRLGSPAAFAQQYRGERSYLIGPDYFDQYCWFLKLVLLCTALPVLAVAVVEGMRQADGGLVSSIVRGLVDGIIDLVTACVGAFGGVTLTFAVMERCHVRLDQREDDGEWSPRLLTPVPHKKARISRGDSVVSIVFIVIFGVLLIAAPQFFSIVFPNGGELFTVPVFHLAQWSLILPVLLLSLAVGLVDEVLRLVIGQYSRPVMVSSIVCGLLQLGLSILVLRVFPIWNPGLAEAIQAQLGESAGPFLRLFEHWDGARVSDFLIGFFTAITALEIGVTVYRTLRYGEKTV